MVYDENLKGQQTISWSVIVCLVAVNDENSLRIIKYIAVYARIWEIKYSHELIEYEVLCAAHG